MAGEQVTFNPDAVTAWLERVYGQAPGLLSVAHQDKGGKFHAAGGTVDTHNDAAQLVARLDRASAHSIYLRTTTLAARPSAGERGGVADALALPGFWADVDFGDVGHRHDPAKHDGRPLPPDAAEAKRIVTESGLPAPSLWVHSGGGLYPWWLLDQPLILDDQNRHGITAMSASWQQALQRSAHRIGYEYGAGVGDLARVLRIPGTVNRKDGKARPCHVVQDDGTAYTLADLTSALQKATPAPSPSPAPAAPLPRSAFDTTPRTGASAFDLLDQHATFDDILTGADWIRCTAGHASNIEACWTRPGNPEHSCSAHTLAAMPEALVVFSESAGLPVGAGQKLTRGRLFAHLWHHGDERASALDLYAAIGGRPSTPAAAALPLPREARPVNMPSTIGLQDLVALEHRQAQLEANRPPDDLYPDGADPATDPAVVLERARAGLASQEYERQLARRTALERIRTEEDQVDPATFDDQYLDADQLGNLPTPEPMIAGVLDRHCYAILRGRDGTYKTFLALDWALCLATGKPWQGKHVQQARVLYIAGEGAYGINARKKAWELAWRTQVDPAWFTLRQSAVNLYKGGQPLEDLIARTTQGAYGLVIIDTLRRASGGAEGNGTDMGVVVDNIERIKRATHDGSALTLTHTDKGDNDSRGFSGIEDDADIVWHAKRDKDRGPLALTLENTKMKDGPEGLILNLTMAPAAGSLVVSKTADRLTVDEMHDADQAILTAMRETFALTGATVSQLVDVTGLPKTTVYRARGRLLNSGQLDSQKRGSSDWLTITNNLFGSDPLSTIPTHPEHDSHPDMESDPGFPPDSHPDSQGFPLTPEHDSHPFPPDSHRIPTPIPTIPTAFRQEGNGNPVEPPAGDTPKCSLCHTQDTLPGRGICTTCDQATKAAS